LSTISTKLGVRPIPCSPKAPQDSVTPQPNIAIGQMVQTQNPLPMDNTTAQPVISESTEERSMNEQTLDTEKQQL